ncbi:MAG TPA: hypothetical protein VIQ31_19040, partial [Phormidium sp.]
RLLNCHSLFLHTQTTYLQSKQHSTIEVEQVFGGKNQVSINPCPALLLITNEPGAIGRLLNCHSLFLHT